MKMGLVPKNEQENEEFTVTFQRIVHEKTRYLYRVAEWVDTHY